jgi:hypothetical protein
MKPDIFLDSGAYSMHTQERVKVDIYKYIEYVKAIETHLSHYAVLDIIGNASLTKKNQSIMEQHGLSPIPCFHYGEEYSYLEYYINNYEYIALGGMAPVNRSKLVDWLNHVFSNYICDKNGMPKVKVHGFGMTTVSLMSAFPWWSFDSTSWVINSKFGRVKLPNLTTGSYANDSVFISVSEKRAHKRDNFKSFAPAVKQKIGAYLETLKPYLYPSLQHNILQGCITEYEYRYAVNILFYLQVEKSLPEWPWVFTTKIPKQLTLNLEAPLKDVVKSGVMEKGKTTLYFAGEAKRGTKILLQLCEHNKIQFKRMLTYAFRKTKYLNDVLPLFEKQKGD